MGRSTQQLLQIALGLQFISMLWCLAALNEPFTSQAVLGCELSLCGSIIMSIWALRRRTAVLTKPRQARFPEALKRSQIAYSDSTQEGLQSIQAQLLQALEIAGMIAWERDLQTDEIFFTTSQPPGHPQRLPYEEAIALVHPDDRDRVHRANQEAIAHQSGFAIEHRLADPQHPAGWRWFYVSAKVLTDDTDQATRLLGMSLDITDRKESEAILKQANQDMEAMLQAYPDLLVRVLADGTICDYKAQKPQNLYGPSEQFLGRKLHEVLPADIAATIDRGMQQALASGEVETVQYVLPLPHRDTYFEARIVTLNADSVMVVTRDITDLKTAELAARASEAKFSTIFYENPVPAWIATFNEGRCLHVNQSLCDLLGYAPNEVLGELCVDFQLWQDETQLHKLRCQLQAQGVVRHFETTWQTKSRALKTVLLSTQLVTIDGERCVIGVVDDITARKYTEVRLQQLSQELLTWRDRYEVATWAGRQIVYEYDILNDSYTWGPNTHEILGYDIEEMPQTVEEAMGFVHPSDQSTFIDFLAHRHHHEEPYSVEFRVLRRDGTYIWVEDQSVPQVDDQGVLVNVIGAIRDLSEIKAAEHALRNSEVLFRAVFEQSILGIAFNRLDQDVLKSLRVNQQLCTMLGYSEAELLSLTPTDLIYPDDQAVSLTKLRQVLTGEITHYQLERRYVRKDGSYFWANVRSVVLQGIPDMPGLQVLLVEDISDRKRFDVERTQLVTQLKASEAQYLAILQHQTEVIARFKSDGTVLFVNDAFYRYYGVAPEEVLGKTYHPLIYPEDQPAIDQCLASLSPDHPVATVQNRVYVKGEIRWTEWTNRAIYDEHGHLIELQAVGRDIHDQRLAAAALQDSQAKFQRLVDDIGDKFVVFSHTGPGHGGIVTYVSDGVQSVFGVQKEDIVDQSWSTAIDWLPGEVRMARQKTLAMIDHHLDFQQFEMRFKFPNGETHIVSVSQHLVRDRAGQLVAIEGIVEDITERKQFERQLQTLNDRLQIANARLEKLATLDTLTQVANRRKMEQVLETEWSRCHREQQPITLMLLDIDCFKLYNDHYGHLQGDQCLRQVAQLLQMCMRRSTDLVTRYGGEEFLLILPNTDTDGAITMARHIQAELAEMAIPHQYSSVSDQVTVSIGIAVVSTIIPKASYGEAIHIADQALYQAKVVRNAYHIERVN